MGGTDIVEFSYDYDPNTNDIAEITYVHRDSNTVDYAYDNLDRLTLAEYSIDDNNEAFTIDDLGSRDSVIVRDGNNVNYDIDNLSNRYDSVGGNTLAYDAAGNLTTDKDGYQYEYDYENRITKIIKSGPTTVAEFAYDALGRRIKKRDSIANTNNIYYYNDNWQILCDYNDTGAGGTPERWFAYGNYIDEVLVMNTTTAAVLAKLYVHDHLFSPVALVQMYHIDLKERYEYDAYGNCYVLEPNFAPDPDNKTDYGNPYQFTGRSLDVLDGGLLKIMQYRHRYYDTYTGRFTTHDPMGYIDGLNLYEYAKSNPVTYFDPGGWFACEECCGTDENYNKKVYNSVVRGLGALLSLYQRKDSADFGADWAKRTYVSHTEGMLAETSIEDEKDRIIEAVAQMYIDCFVETVASLQSAVLSCFSFFTVSAPM